MTIQKIIVHTVALIISCGVMTINMYLSLNPFSNTRMENLAIFISGMLVWAALTLLIYKTGFRMEISWEKGK
jgi:predicted membrane protein